MSSIKAKKPKRIDPLLKEARYVAGLLQMKFSSNESEEFRFRRENVISLASMLNQLVNRIELLEGRELT